MKFLSFKKSYIKRALALLILIICTMIIPLSFAGATSEYSQEGRMPSVIDEAGFLSDNEVSSITSRLDELRDRYQVDVAIVTEQAMLNDDAKDRADDIFDYNPYGMGDGNDGILLYVSAHPRKYHVSAHGNAMNIFNKRGLVYLTDNVEKHLRDNDYYGAFCAYADSCEEILETAAQGKPYNKPDTMTLFITLAVVLLIPLAAAGFMTYTKISKMHTAVKENYASNYVKEGSFQLSRSNDIFIYSNTVRTKRPESNSGTHTSSSGETHSGRGGSY